MRIFAFARHSGLILTVATLHPGMPAAGALVARWTMDSADITGTAVNDVVGSIQGTLVNAPVTGVPGHLGQAVELAGGADDATTNQYIDLTDAVTSVSALRQGTITAWVKPRTGGVNDVLSIFTVSDASVGTGEARFYVDNSTGENKGKLAYGRRSAAASSAVDGSILSTTTLFDNKWHHVAVTVDDTGSAALYVDGAEEASDASIGFLDIPGASSSSIGRNLGSTAPPGAGQWFYDGFIDDVAVYDTPLDATAIASLAKEGVLDCNGDGIPDAWYTLYGLNACTAGLDAQDGDSDGLTNRDEYEAGTDPTRADTDNDGLRDGDEVNTWGTDPLRADTDDDLLSDGQEVQVWNTDPKKADSDADGFGDGVEILADTDPKAETSLPVISLTDELFAHYTFDDADAAGTTLGDTGGNDAGPFSGTATNGGPLSAPGLFGEAGEFAGGADNGFWEYVDLNAHAAAFGALTQGSLSAWVRIPAEGLTTDVLTILALSDEFDGSSEFRFYVTNTGNLACGVRNDGTTVNSIVSNSGDNLLDGAWHHAGVTCNAGEGTLILFIDGHAVSAAAPAFFADVQDVNSVSIGRDKDSTAGGGQWFFDGFMDDLAVWSRPLRAAEMGHIYQEGRSGRPVPDAVSTAPYVITDVTRDAATHTVTVSWNSIPGRRYVLEFSANLSTWTDVGDTTAGGPTATLTDVLAHTGISEAYYRIRLLP